MVPRPRLTIVTGCSSNHFASQIQFLDSVRQFDKGQIRLVVYDLGLNPGEFNRLKQLFPTTKGFASDEPKVIYRRFDYSLYPPHVNIAIKAGQYAWKPIIIHEVCQKYSGLVCWMDAGNKIVPKVSTVSSRVVPVVPAAAGFAYDGKAPMVSSLINPLDRLINVIKHCKLYSPLSAGNIRRWTHPGTLRSLDYRGSQLLPNRNAACVGVNCNYMWVREIIDQWRKCALNVNCIAPPGSNRANHRQDQAVLTVLFYQYHERYKFPIINNLIGVTLHNDVGPFMRR